MSVQHIVLLKFKPGASNPDLKSLFDALEKLRQTLPGFLHYSFGANNSPEGLAQDFTHAFLMTFADVNTRDNYLEHPDHEAVKLKFLPLVEKIVVFDYETNRM